MQRELVCLALGAIAAIAADFGVSSVRSYLQLTGTNALREGELESVDLEMGGPIMARLHIVVAVPETRRSPPTIAVSHPPYGERTELPGTEYPLSRDDVNFLDTVLRVTDFDDLSRRYHPGQQKSCQVTDAGYVLLTVRRAGITRTLSDDGQTLCRGVGSADVVRVNLLTGALEQLSRRFPPGTPAMLPQP